MYKITCIIPYPQLGELLESRAREMKDVYLQIREGALSTGALQGQTAEQEGAEAIIGVGETAQAIKNSVDIPVVRLRDYGYDITRALAKARTWAHHIAMMVQPENLTLVDNELIEKLLGIKLYVFPVDRTETVPQVFEAVQKQGLQVVVGGINVIYEAKKRGLPGVAILFGPETIDHALQEAKLAAETRRQQNAQAGQLEAILDSAHEGILSIDEIGRITALNYLGAQILGLQKQKALGKHVLDIAPILGLDDTVKTGKLTLGSKRDFDGELISISRLPIVLDGKVKGAVATFQPDNIPEKQAQPSSFKAKFTLDHIIGVSPALLDTKRKAQRYAQTDSTILITGVSGTGKELFAQAIHNASPRHEEPFVAINCTALPDSILESELFGYEEGAFTGARKGGNQGLFELAQGGTIFLDEIATMSPRLQTILLRVLQEREIRPVGSTRIFPVDVRIIAASNTDLKDRITQGSFRSDLYYRLSVLHLEIPSLADRREDIPILANHFAQELYKNLGKEIKINTQVLSTLQAYDWPGNIRELRNFMERLVLLAERPEVTLTHLQEASEEMSFHFDDQDPTIVIPFTGQLADMEQEVIKRQLKLTNGNKTAAATRIGISRATLIKKLNRMKSEAAELL